MNIKKIALSAGVGISTLALAALPALAQDITASNDTTGSNSTNKIKIKITSDSNVTQTNIAEITNDISVSNNTGGNQASYNTGSGSVTTGDATSDVKVSNLGNVNTAPDCLCQESDYYPTIDASNSNTGYNSTNKVKVRIRKAKELKQDNISRVNNKVDIKNKTGKNRANHNTGGGTVDTGITDSVIDVSTDVNHNQ